MSKVNVNTFTNKPDLASDQFLVVAKNAGPTSILI